MTEDTRLPRIVVIDDNELMLETMVNMLALLNGTVVPAASGKAGLEEVAQNGADIVITDILMPEKDGLEIIMELRKAAPGVKIIAVSGGGQLGFDSYLTHARTLGADIVLAKPFALDDLMKAIENCGVAVDPPHRSGS